MKANRSLNFVAIALVLAALVLAACSPTATPTSTPIEAGSPTAQAAETKTPVPAASPTATTQPATPTSPPATPSPSPSPAPSLAFSSIQMMTLSDGWAADAFQGKVYRTVDGGMQWVDVSPAQAVGGRAVTYFMSVTQAWLITWTLPTTSNGPSEINTYRTIDGGQTWNMGMPFSLVSEGLISVDFTTPDNGWLMVGLSAGAGSVAVAVYRTADGGRDWSQVSATLPRQGPSTPGSLPLGCDKAGLRFLNAVTGWAAGSCPGGGLFFYATNDAGEDWTPQILPPPPGYASDILSTCQCGSGVPVFVSRQVGMFPVFIVTEQENVGFLYVTQDGGTTWTPRKMPIWHALGGVDFIDPNNGWITDGEQLYSTSDTGQNWIAVADFPSTNLVGSLSFVDAMNGWFTDGQQIFVTHDGGVNWQAFMPTLVSGPVPPAGKTVTLADNGKSITLRVGDTFLLDLGEGFDWTVEVADQSIVSRVPNITVIVGAQGVYKANAPGTTTLTAVGDPTCRKATPPCAAPSVQFTLTITVEPAGATITLTQVEMMSLTDGWGADMRAHRLYRTSDGGASWKDVTPVAVPTGQSDMAFFFLNLTDAWIVSGQQAPGTAAPTYSETITTYRTTDGGNTWQSAPPITIQALGFGGLQFIDPQHGWLVAGLGVALSHEGVAIYRTEDGGQTWNQVSLTSGMPDESTPGALPFACDKNGISFVSATTGWAGGFCPGGEVFFYVTHDGGQTWEHAQLPPPPGYPSDVLSSCQCGLNPPVFISANEGFLTVGIFEQTQSSVMYATADGGSTWTPSILPVQYVAATVDFVDATNGWVTDGQDLYGTRDGGQTWTKVGPLPVTNLLGNLNFVDSQNGWLTGGGQLYVTHDAGQHWQPITPVLSSAPSGG